MIQRLITIFILFSFSYVSASDELMSQINFPVERFKLDNGLVVILQKDSSVPLISYHTWFRVGSKDEEPGHTGLAHFFEHLMFKGAKRFSGDDFSRVLRENGGNFNAFTTRDYTGYFISAPSSKLELIMDIESDRMVNLKLTPEVISSEREVVKEEKRWRFDNNVVGTFYENIFEKTFVNSPYRWPVIGSMEDLDRVDVSVAMEFYRQYYAPNNAVICIVGDINIENTKNLIKKYYKNLSAQKIKRNQYAIDPIKEKSVTNNIVKEAQNDYFAYTYLIPPVGSDESFVFEVLAKVFGQGNSSRIHKKLVYDSRVATSVASYQFGMKEQDLFQIYFALKPEKSLDKKNEMVAHAQQTIDQELLKLQSTLVSEKEIQKARNNIVMEMVDSLKTLNGRARGLISNEILFGSYEKLFTDIGKYMQVTPEQVRTVAKKYLNKNQRTVIRLVPGKESKK